MSNKKYEPHHLFSWWSWYWAGPDHTHQSYLSRELFDLLRGGNPYEDYRRDYPTRVEAMCDLAQAQAALKAQEGQSVTTTTEKTQGEPIELGKVLPGDVVRLVRTYSDGYEQTAKGVVAATESQWVKLKCLSGTVSWVIESGPTFETRLFLLHRPPRRREISKDELIESTPIGTRVVLEFPNESGQKAGAATKVFRDHVGWAVSIDRATVYYLDDIKAIYTEEVQG